MDNNVENVNEQTESIINTSEPQESGVFKKLENKDFLKIASSIRNALDEDESTTKRNSKSLKNLNTHLTRLPDGKETGKYFSIDLGGTKLRVCKTTLKKKQALKEFQEYTVPQECKTGTGDQLFKYIADRIAESLKMFNEDGKAIKFMGYTFSFPCIQTSLNGGKLITWTKGYSASDVVDDDVVERLQKACRNRGLKIKDFILINDSTGTLLCGSLDDQECYIGVINGTGTNACYLKQNLDLTNLEEPLVCKSVVINTEIGGFGEHKELDEYRSKVDRELDAESINPGCQIFEKLVSGLYIGEMIRRTIISAPNDKQIFDDNVPDQLKIRNSFPSTYASHIYNHQWCIEKFQNKFKYVLTNEQYKKILDVCDAIIERSAGLVSAGLLALILKINRRSITIAADGSMFHLHPNFKLKVNECLSSLLPEEYNFKIKPVTDGSGIGAAIAACIVTEHPEIIENHPARPSVDLA